MHEADYSIHSTVTSKYIALARPEEPSKLKIEKTADFINQRILQYKLRGTYIHMYASASSRVLAETCTSTPDILKLALGRSAGYDFPGERKRVPASRWRDRYPFSGPLCL
jgi:hypothetical protein